MTDGHLSSLPLSAANAHAAPDAESCLVLVASYVGAAPLVEKVTAEATRRLLKSPTLGDFIELRYAHLGHQPAQGSQQLAAAARITGQLLQPRPGIGRHFFAVVILDRSAAAVEAVLRDCAASPFLSRLPIRLLGIASREDRRLTRLPRGAEILVSPVGAWQRPELVNELLRYADSLLHEFAGQRRHGLSPDELTRHRNQFGMHLVQERSVTPRTGVMGTGSFAAMPDVSAAGPGIAAAPVRDALDPGADPGQPMLPAPSVPPPAASAQGTPSVPPLDARQSGRAYVVPVPPDFSVGDDVQETEEADVLPARSLPRLVRRLMPEVRWRRGQPDEERPAQPSAAAGGLAYLLLTGDPDVGDPAEWNRSRALALEIDQRLAALPRLSAQVRALHGDDMELRGDLKAAGQLAKRDVRGAVSDLCLAKVLDQVRMTLGRDEARLSAGLPLARPVVVLLAPVPPMADSAAVASLRRLAEDASITWVIPKSQADLMSEEFTEAGQLITDFTVAADDVAALFPAFPAPDNAQADDAREEDGTQAPDGTARNGTGVAPDPAA